MAISSRVVDDKLTSRRAEAHASSTTRPANGLFQQPRNAENHGVPTKFSWHAVCLSHTATPLPNRIIQEKISRSGFKTPERHHSTRHDLIKIRSRAHHTENQRTKIVITEIYCTFVPIFNAYQHVLEQKLPFLHNISTAINLLRKCVAVILQPNSYANNKKKLIINTMV